LFPKVENRQREPRAFVFTASPVGTCRQRLAALLV
jgi:hypothetical protein